MDSHSLNIIRQEKEALLGCTWRHTSKAPQCFNVVNYNLQYTNEMKQILA